ncbi:hypothetical protein F383_09581 [Gossypium arboreum]|uniref:Uncharacterized protein n=1 Tax=Gossypium arboreum TaxID=29729 RepID=A0A0B0P1C9_GOSAR|nr:hypothetical protein F383_09581 [Gossypium arboreum]
MAYFLILISHIIIYTYTYLLIFKHSIHFERT